MEVILLNTPLLVDATLSCKVQINETWILKSLGHVMSSVFAVAFFVES